MRRAWILVTAICLLGFAYFWSSEIYDGKKRIVASESGPKTKIKDDPVGRYPSAAVAHPAKTALAKRKSKKSAAPRGFPHPALPEGYLVSTDTFAVKGYESSMGERLEDRGGFTFVRSRTRPSQGATVAIDPLGRYYVVNKVLKLSGISEEMRRELIDQGITEHYYRPDLKLLYVEGPEDTLKFYEELVEINLKPEVELNRNFHRPK